MVKKENNQYMKNNKALPKEDIEFANENGLEKKALKALKSHNK